MTPITCDYGTGSYSVATILYNTASTASTYCDAWDTYPQTTWKTNRRYTDNYIIKWGSSGTYTNWSTNNTDDYSTWSTNSDSLTYHYDGDTWSLQNPLWLTRPKTARQKLHEIIQARHTPAIHTRRRSVILPQDPREIKAHDTLQLLIGPQRYRQYLKNGYVTIHSHQNGKTYQVYPGTQFTHVYDHGQREPNLCIYLAHEFPPTDQLIAKILLIQTDPNHYHRIANKHRPAAQTIIAPLPANELTLPEIYAKLKQKVA